MKDGSNSSINTDKSLKKSSKTDDDYYEDCNCWVCEFARKIVIQQENFRLPVFFGFGQ